MSDKNNEKVVLGSTCSFCAERSGKEKKVKPDDAFIKSEMMAEEHIDRIQTAIQELASGNTDICLDLLRSIEEKMHVTLAFGELFDIESTGTKVH